MTITELTLALAALLFAPGPTNTLLALIGARQGLVRSLPLIGVVLACYLAVTLPLALWGEPVMTALPALRPTVTVAAAVWVAMLALRLWQGSTAQAPLLSLGARAVATTTLLNPKALLIGLILLPEAESLSLGYALFLPILLQASLVWLGLGSILRGHHARAVQRGAALWLAVVAALLIGKALA